MTESTPSINRGEVWQINFDPTIGDEIQKTRPAVIISIEAAFRHRLRIVVPITGWQAKFADEFWMRRLPATSANGLGKESAANCFQVKSVSEERFVKKLGGLSETQLEEIIKAIAFCIGFDVGTSDE